MTSVLLTLVALLAPVWLSGLPPGVPTRIGSHGAELLLGTGSALYRHGAAGWVLVMTRGGVRDLARGPEGTLIATGAGLYRWRLGEDKPRAVPLGAGARVCAVATDAMGTEWVASEVGLFARARGQQAFQRHDSIPPGAVWGVRVAGSQVWAATRSALWVAERQGEFEARLRGVSEGWWELNGAVDWDDGNLISVPKGLWHVVGTDMRRVPLDVGTLRGIARWGRRLFLAADRGVFSIELDQLESTASRVELSTEAVHLVAEDRGLLVATRRGIALLSLAAAKAPQLGFRRTAPDGELARLQRAVLVYLELSPSRLRSVEARARRVGVLPEVRASLGIDRDRTGESEHDQTFSSGDVWNLLDSSSRRDRGFSVDVQFVWDLAQLSAPDHALAISRERRLLIELRDQVLERVNRLYFERRHLLAQLDALPPDSTAERAASELRAEELAAGLDAWTGGMFSRLATNSPPATERSEK